MSTLTDADPEPIVAPTRDIRIPVPSGPEVSITEQPWFWTAIGAGVAAIVVMLILQFLGVKLKVWLAVGGVVVLTVFVVKLLGAT